MNIEGDSWKPTRTSLPFGPYRPAGALVCTLFATQLSKAIDGYWSCPG